MEREEVLRWLRTHPQTRRADPREVVERCERAVRRHAREDAWLAAKAYVEERRHGWEGGVGAHASEVHVAREVCHQLAAELGHHEPRVRPEDAEHLAGRPLRDAVDADGWELLIDWVVELARKEEHETWEEIVRHTDRRARELIREHHLSDECSFDHSRCYDEIAVQIAQWLERDYASHAFPRAGRA